MTSSNFSLAFDLQQLSYAERRVERELEKKREIRRLESSLIDFVEGAWATIDPAEYLSTWAIDGICEHLQAVTEGHIRRLLINVPPRSAKTTIASICWPAWTWARSARSYLSGPQVRFLCGSYGDRLSLENSTKTRRLILGPWYQARWGKRYTLRDDQNTKSQFDNTEGGSRFATSVGGSLLGLGGDIIEIDDPHDTEGILSEADRRAAENWWKEISSTRLNNPQQSAIVVVMQRLHESDVSGLIQGSDEYPDDWTHYMVPMRHDPMRHCVTVLRWDEAGEPVHWEDPRTEPGELMWPERFGEREVASIESRLGPYMSSGRLQQMPVTDEGAIFKRSWWELWDDPAGKFPVLEYVIASLDSAFTKSEMNDPSALTVWGVFLNRENKRRIILIHAWQKFLQFSGVRVDTLPGETAAMYKRRTSAGWGLMEWVQDTCLRFKVDKLLIEAKASGISAAQELQNRYGLQDWSVHLMPVKGDKVARALAVQATFSQGMVYAPERDWAEEVIVQAEQFPLAKHDDLVDSMTLAVKYLRDVGLAATDEEVLVAETDRVTHKSPLKALYPV